MQHVTHVTTQPITSIARMSTIPKRQNKMNGAGLAKINRITCLAASGAGHRCRYMTGAMKLAINAHARTKRTITNIHAPIANIRYTS